MELGESVVRDLLRCEGVGDHADRPPPCPEDGVGHDSHQPDPAAAVDKVNPVSHKFFAHLASRFPVRGQGARR